MSLKEISRYCPEQRLLLLCTCAVLDDERAGPVYALLRQELDWERLLTQARRHHLEPFLCRHIDARASDIVPPTILAELHKRSEASLRRSLRLAAELNRLLRTLQAQGIQALAYKGPMLALAAYGSVELRACADLDIIVRRSDAVAACQMLREDGYRERVPLPSSAPEPLDTSNYCLAFTANDGRADVELHWALASSFLPWFEQLEPLWERRQVSGLGRDILMPSREDLLLLLCLHGAKDGWSRLEWIGNVAGLLRPPGESVPLDWDYLQATARCTGTQRMFRLGLALASDLWAAGTSAPLLPPEIAAWVAQDRAIPALGPEVWSRVLDAEQPLSLLALGRFWLHACQNQRDRCRVLWRLATRLGPGDFAMVSLPRTLRPFYFLARPFRLVTWHALGKG
jgi:hypothetical protein